MPPVLNCCRLFFLIFFFGFFQPFMNAVAEAPQYRETRWEELVPETWKPEEFFKEFQDLDDLSDGDPRAKKMLEILAAEWKKAPANKKFEKTQIKIPGFIAPLEWEKDGNLKEFLLVPYFGACIHTPPPPANQIIYVKMDKPLKKFKSMDSIWVYGKIELETNDSGTMGTSGYSMVPDKVTRYE